MPKNLSIKDFAKKNINNILGSSILLILFYAFSFFFVKGGKLNRFDFDMTVRIQGKVPIRLDPYLSILSFIGSFEVMVVVLAIFAFIKMKFKAVFPVAMFCLMHVVEIVGKAFLDHPPTPFMFHRYAFDFVFPSGYVQPGGSYPSGHAMRTSFVVIFISYFVAKSKLKKEFKFVIWAGLFAFYLAMVISRVSLGEHWTSDIIGGTFLGSAFALLSLIFA